MKLLYRTLGIAVLVVAAICTAQSQTTPSVITMHDAATATGNGTALVVSVNSAAAGANLGAVGIQITGTFSATITFEATTDGTNWTAVMATELADDSRATTATAAGHYTVIFGSAIRIRARISSYSSGSVTVKARLIPGLTARLTSGGGGGGSGTVTSVAFTGGLISVADPTTAAALTVAGTSGGIPYFSSTSTWASSAALAANALVIGGGAGVAPATTTTGTGVLTALGVNVGSAGAFVTFNGALGTPSSGVGTNLTGTAAGLTAGTATALQTARTIGDVSFDGTANITVASATGGFEVTTGITTPSTTFALVNATATTINFAGAATTLNVGTSATVLNFGGGATAGEFRFLEPSGSGTNYSAFKAVAQGANITYSLPPTVGAAGTVLTDAAGDGVLTWAAGGSVSGANPTASVGLSAVNGVATTYLRSDGAPALDQGIVPTWTGIHTFNNGVTTGTGATSGTVFSYNSLTTGVGANISSSSVTSGSILNIASTSTAGLTGMEALNIAVSGANGTAAQTITGATISVTNTNATSGTNIGLSVAASGATTTNRAIEATAGGIFVTSNTGTLMMGIAVSGQPTVGIGRNSGVGGLDLYGDTSATANISATQILMLSTARLGWSGSTLTQPIDLILRRSAAANLAFGAADAASPVAQTLSVQNVVGGTSNTAGADWTKKASAGTGTGVGGAHVWQVAPAGGSGTTQNSFVEAMRITGAGVIQYPTTITAGGTTGNQTISKVTGTVNFAAAATSLTVTNTLVSTNSICFAVVRTNDTTALIKNVVPGSGSFVINLNAAATAETSVGFFCVNP